MICRPANSTEIAFDVVLEEFTETVSGSEPELVTEADANIARTQSAVTTNGFVVNVEATTMPRSQLDLLQIESGSKGSVSGNKVTRVSDGDDFIKVFTPWLSKSMPVTFSQVGGQTADALVNFVEGSFARECADQLDDRIQLGGELGLFAPYSLGSFLRNSECWIGDVDLTCASAWHTNSDGSYSGGGLNTVTAISPRHVIYASHWLHPVGRIFHFVTADNQIVTRSLTDVVVLPGDWTNTDTAIGKLDSDLPSSIAPAKMLPANLRDYVVSVRFGVPLLRLNAQEKALVVEWIYDILSSDNQTRKIWFEPPLVESRQPYAESVVAGDSGNPIFAILGGNAALISHTSSRNSGPAYYSFLADINAAMTTLGGGYQLTIADLSAYTDFSA